MKIDLLNYTHYSSRYLKRLFGECEHREQSDVPWRIVMVDYSYDERGRPYSSHGAAGAKAGASIDLYLSQDMSARILCALYIHELQHTMGKKHKTMKPIRDIDTSWWPDESVPKAGKPRRPFQDCLEYTAASSSNWKTLKNWKHRWAERLARHCGNSGRRLADRLRGVDDPISLLEFCEELKHGADRGNLGATKWHRKLRKQASSRLDAIRVVVQEGLTEGMILTRLLNSRDSIAATIERLM